MAYHQSDLPFLGIGYTIADRWTPELRLGTNQYVDLMSVEGVLTYQYLQKENYQLSAGLGIYYNQFEGEDVSPSHSAYNFILSKIKLLASTYKRHRW